MDGKRLENSKMSDCDNNCYICYDEEDGLLRSGIYVLNALAHNDQVKQLIMFLEKSEIPANAAIAKQAKKTFSDSQYHKYVNQFNYCPTCGKEINWNDIDKQIATTTYEPNEISL